MSNASTPIGAHAKADSDADTGSDAMTNARRTDSTRDDADFLAGSDDADANGATDIDVDHRSDSNAADTHFNGDPALDVSHHHFTLSFL
jgi:hypothetical protein